MSGAPYATRRRLRLTVGLSAPPCCRRFAWLRRRLGHDLVDELLARVGR